MREFIWSTNLSSVAYTIDVGQVLYLECYELKLVARYGTCPTLVVWVTDEGFIDQMVTPGSSMLKTPKSLEIRLLIKSPKLETPKS